MENKLTFLCFRGGDRPNRPHLDPPLAPPRSHGLWTCFSCNYHH